VSGKKRTEELRYECKKGHHAGSLDRVVVVCRCVWGGRTAAYVHIAAAYAHAGSATYSHA